MEDYGSKKGKSRAVFGRLSGDGCVSAESQTDDRNNDRGHVSAAVQCVCVDVCSVPRPGTLRCGDVGRCAGAGGSLHCGGHVTDSWRTGDYRSDVPMCLSEDLCRELSRRVGVHHAGSQFLSDAAGRAGGVLCGEATFVLMYGSLVIRERTGNAWGNIFLFFVVWNAL